MGTAGYSRVYTLRIAECCVDSAAASLIYAACTVLCVGLLLLLAAAALAHIPFPGVTDVPSDMSHLNRADLASLRFHLLQGDFNLWTPSPPAPPPAPPN